MLFEVGRGKGPEMRFTGLSKQFGLHMFPTYPEKEEPAIRPWFTRDRWIHQSHNYRQRPADSLRRSSSVTVDNPLLSGRQGYISKIPCQRLRRGDASYMEGPRAGRPPWRT